MMFARSFCVKSLVPPVSTHQTRSAQIQTDCPLEGDPGVDSAPAVFIIIAAAGALPPLHEYDERLQGLAASRRARCYFPLTCWASVLMCRARRALPASRFRFPGLYRIREPEAGSPSKPRPPPHQNAWSRKPSISMSPTDYSSQRAWYRR